ncbi:MAG: Uma2 family endonuclease [Lentimicrobiaceae bacterium]|nr:Uma2 family endonuclease [Lentimicrobiaceae bacterium]
MSTQEKNYEDLLKELEQQNTVVEEPPIGYTAHRYSYADYLTWTDDRMREIIGGIVYLFSAPIRKHAAAIIPFIIQAGSFIRRKKGKCKIYTAPFDVRLPKNGETDDDKIFDVVQPDICVVCDPAKLDDKGCIGAPDLIVEVNSPSTNLLDLKEKFLLYEESGVKEYWVVFPKEKRVTVFLLQPDGKYGNGKKYQGALGKKKVPVKTLKGLVIDLEELFEED